MPKWLHRKLERQADKLERQGKLRDRDAYIYDVLREYGKRRARKARRRKRRSG